MAIAAFQMRRTKLLLFAGALLAALVSTPAPASFAQSTDSGQLISRINQLENQVQTLSRALYRGEIAKPGTPGRDDIQWQPAGGSAALAGYETRLADLESQQRNMLGQVERLTHEVSQLKAQLARTEADNSLRLEDLSAAGGGRVTGHMPVLTGNAYAEPAPYRETTSRQTLGRLSADRGAAEDPAAGLYESAFSDVRDARYQEAETKFRKFMSLYSRHALAANAQYWLGETHYVRGDYREAAKIFAQNYQDYPQGSKAPDSLLKLGLALSKLGKDEDACLSLMQLQKEFQGVQSPVVNRADKEIKRMRCRG